MYQYFTFKGINSLDMGVVMLKAPSIYKPTKRVNEIQIAGRNGILHEDTNTYENYTKEAECQVMDRSRIDDVSAWLNGYGEVIFSSEPDKVYRAFIKNQIPFNNILLNLNDFLVQFDCFPFKYSVDKADEELSLTAPTTIYNQGTIYSEPIITVYGTGNIALTINEKNYTITGIDGYVTINSEIQEVYKDSTNKNNSFSALDFPKFQEGANTISWTGSVTRLEIKPNWRWL
ncbi:phage tail domain-containing protein [Anaerotignum propionicum]|uniref:Phage tail protein n=1 Tax=Anaerotignum propionicum DSM 1682 TaxID=991789 RepID=A0ABM5YC84_ANAPI|nr:phage tail domain-containing protein [Anaerotignum propionicum]AMJ41687.1 phage tail protein [Anaerotignum propionicum DSM 1682]AMJ42324.1 phage tail protein [Anaerotignum propionicum DSM 1682]